MEKKHLRFINSFLFRKKDVVSKPNYFSPQIGRDGSLTAKFISFPKDLQAPTDIQHKYFEEW